MVRRELDPARMLDATAEALMPALALSGLSIHTLADGALGRPLTEAGKPAHTDLLAALVKRLEGDRQSVEMHDAAGDLLVRATRYRGSEEHTSELQSLMRTTYAGFGWKKKKK